MKNRTRTRHKQPPLTNRWIAITITDARQLKRVLTDRIEDLKSWVGFNGYVDGDEDTTGRDSFYDLWEMERLAKLDHRLDLFIRFGPNAPMMPVPEPKKQRRKAGAR